MGYLEDLNRLGPKANPFFQLMGIEVNSFADGKAKLSMRVRPDMLNGVGWLQGGIYSALCDEAMALALYTLLDEGELIATIFENTSFLRGIRGGKVYAEAKVVRKGRQIAFTEGYVENSEDAVLSKTVASFAIFKETG
jgi:acyl-CoA thioesterase